ncbi:MAG TPA: sugar phosphate nucleotidyltransferase [Thermoplasmata archaeon]|nr:sugar phosphate nucleotidyltransferase [Thermoplasmata archaeon]
MRGVLTLAGEGTRMLPWTRGLRKEFLPLYDAVEGGPPVLKPVAHHVLESMAEAGVTDFTLVVGAKDRAFVQNYFSVDPRFLDRHAHHRERIRETERLYRTLGRVRIHFAVQPRPRGFGDAVLRAEPFVRGEPFLLHAADALLWERPRGAILRRLAARVTTGEVDAVLVVRRVADPRRYGVIEGRPAPRWEGMRRLTVERIEEKPDRPRSSWAATAAYAFTPKIFEALRAVRRAHPSAELELTDAIQWLLSHGGRVEALVLTPRWGEWWSVGTPLGFVRALRRTEHLARARAASRTESGRQKD